jgi:hypothetical protein
MIKRLTNNIVTLLTRVNWYSFALCLSIEVQHEKSAFLNTCNNCMTHLLKNIQRDVKCNTEARTRINEPSTTSNSSIKTTSSCEDEKNNTKTAPKLYLRALVDIEVGQEICYDYGDEYWVNGFDQI